MGDWDVAYNKLIDDTESAQVASDYNDTLEQWTEDAWPTETTTQATAAKVPAVSSPAISASSNQDYYNYLLAQKKLDLESEKLAQSKEAAENDLSLKYTSLWVGEGQKLLSSTISALPSLLNKSNTITTSDDLAKLTGSISTALTNAKASSTVTGSTGTNLTVADQLQLISAAKAASESSSSEKKWYEQPVILGTIAIALLLFLQLGRR